jgi:hypothetical protein
VNIDVIQLSKRIAFKKKEKILLKIAVLYMYARLHDTVSLRDYNFRLVIQRGEIQYSKLKYDVHPEAKTNVKSDLHLLMMVSIHKSISRRVSCLNRSFILLRRLVELREEEKIKELIDEN